MRPQSLLLQRGRVRLNAETRAGGVASRVIQSLQRGRVRLNAEIPAAARDFGFASASLNAGSPETSRKFSHLN